MKVPNPEQTASIVSLILYSFLDPLVFEAYKVPHLSHERLPAIADYDHTEYLRGKAFPVRTRNYSFIVDETDWYLQAFGLISRCQGTSILWVDKSIL